MRYRVVVDRGPGYFLLHECRDRGCLFVHSRKGPYATWFRCVCTIGPGVRPVTSSNWLVRDGDAPDERFPYVEPVR